MPHVSSKTYWHLTCYKYKLLIKTNIFYLVVSTPFEKYESIWIISPSMVENNKCLKPPPSISVCISTYNVTIKPKQRTALWEKSAPVWLPCFVPKKVASPIGSQPKHQVLRWCNKELVQQRRGKMGRSVFFQETTLQGTNLSHQGKRKIIFKSDFWWDMLVPKRVYHLHVEILYLFGL